MLRGAPPWTRGWRFLQMGIFCLCFRVVWSSTGGLCMSYTCLCTECGQITAGIIDEIAAGEASGQSYADFGLHKNPRLPDLRGLASDQLSPRTAGPNSHAGPPQSPPHIRSVVSPQRDGHLPVAASDGTRCPVDASPLSGPDGGRSECSTREGRAGR